MNVKCSDCGMINWATAEVCKRCHARLRTQGRNDASSHARGTAAADAITNDVDVVNSGYAKRAWAGKKWIVIAVAACLVVVTVAFALSKWALKSSTPVYADLIQTSPKYRKVLNILINRQNEIGSTLSPSAQMNGVVIPPRPILLPETLMLYHAGFLIFHQLGSEEASTELPFIMNESTVEPKSKEIESQWRLLERKMGIGNSPTNTSRQWWIVPIGERQFGQITETSKQYDFSSSRDYVEVKFNGKWKPNQAGRALDKSDVSYTTPENIIGRGNWSSADSLRMAVMDSHEVYDGYANLMKNDDGSYVVVDVWFADSPNQHWPLGRDNTDHLRHNMGLPGF